MSSDLANMAIGAPNGPTVSNSDPWREERILLSPALPWSGMCGGVGVSPSWVAAGPLVGRNPVLGAGVASGPSGRRVWGLAGGRQLESPFFHLVGLLASEVASGGKCPPGGGLLSGFRLGAPLGFV